LLFFFYTLTLNDFLAAEPLETEFGFNGPETGTGKGPSRIAVP
jgi:hypothetical protein